MYCHLCRVDGSPSHESSSGHLAAKELAAEAVDRLSEYLAAAIDDDPSTAWSEEKFNNLLKVKIPETTAKTDGANKTRQVFLCDTCNITLPIADLESHRRQKKHTLALYNDQTLEELVEQYVDVEHRRLMCAMPEPQVSVDESEAVKTYTCALCALEVPDAFKYIHEWGIRHLAGRALAVAAAKRTRDQLRAGDRSQDPEVKSKDKSEGKSGNEDKPEDGSGDKSKDKPKFTGKMMRKLLKLYAGKGVDEDIIEDTDGDPEETTTKAKRLTPKQYFSDIIPYLSYVAAFHTVIIDDTEFVTIQIGRDTLKVHVNNYTGIDHFERHCTCYMNCHLCEYNTSGYSCVGEQDKKHVMSLGHIKNVLSPIDNVHLIRKIDDNHAVCALCNVYVWRHCIESHILKDPNHTTALTEALERGKTYRDSKKHLKIMVYSPQARNIGQNQNKWNFGVPKQNNSAYFGGQPCTFGTQNNGNKPAVGVSAQNSVFGSFGSQNSSNFGAQNIGYKPQNFGSTQNTAVGAPQNNTFGSQNNTGTFGVQNSGATSASSGNTGLGSAPMNIGFGTVQNNTPQNTFGTKSTFTQNMGFGGGPTIVAPQNNTTFRSVPVNSATFGTNNGASNSKPGGLFGNSLFRGVSKNFVAAMPNKAFGGVATTTAMLGLSTPPKEITDDKKTQQNPSEKTAKPTSPDGKKNENEARNAINKNGDEDRNKTGSTERPNVNKQNINKRIVVHSSSSSDSE